MKEDTVGVLVLMSGIGPLSLFRLSGLYYNQFNPHNLAIQNHFKEVSHVRIVLFFLYLLFISKLFCSLTTQRV